LIAVDTNVLVRLLIDDPQSQPQVVAAKSLLQTQGPVFVAQIVQEAVNLDCELFTFDRKLSRVDGMKMVVK